MAFDFDKDAKFFVSDVRVYDTSIENIDDYFELENKGKIVLISYKDLKDKIDSACDDFNCSANKSFDILSKGDFAIDFITGKRHLFTVYFMFDTNQEFFEKLVDSLI